MKLSDKIRILRKARGLSQEELGYQLSGDGVSRQTVSDWENGKFEPKLDNIRELADALNVSFDALLDESIDLNDEDTLQKVLLNKNDSKKNVVETNFKYQIYPYVFNMKQWIIYLVLSIVLLPTGITFFVLFIVNGLSNNLIFAFLIVAVICLTAGIPFLSMTIFNGKEMKYGEVVIPCGTLTNTYLHLSISKLTNNVIHIPLEKIDDIKVSNAKNKNHGEVTITLTDRNKPIILNDIVKPYKLVEVYHSLDSFVENPDAYKIL